MDKLLCGLKDRLGQIYVSPIYDIEVLNGLVDFQFYLIPKLYIMSWSMGAVDFMSSTLPCSVPCSAAL